MTIVMTCYIGHFAWQLGILALLAYLLVGIAIPLLFRNRAKMTACSFGHRRGS